MAFVFLARGELLAGLALWHTMEFPILPSPLGAHDILCID
jgi:hypothetical protein